MFQVGDRVKKLHLFGDTPYGYSPEGTIIEINGRWITVRHDRGTTKRGTVGAVPPRYDYEAADLEHLNPLLKLVRALGPNDRPLP